MAGQGIVNTSHAVEPDWFIKKYALGEHMFMKCSACGKVGDDPVAKVIRVSDADYSEWYRFGEHGKEWNAGLSVAALSVIAVFGAVFIGGVVLLPNIQSETRFLLLLLCVSSIAALLVYALIFRRMIRHNEKVWAERRRLKTELLKKYGGKHPAEVGTPSDVQGARWRKYVLVPNGVDDELKYIEYEA